jgi:hypothetical protein
MIVDLKREKTENKDGRSFDNWVIVLPDGQKVLVKPVFGNGIETLLIAYLQEKGDK